MANPWQGIPLSEYEGHMRSEGVRQLDALARLFERALELRRPESVAILGVAGGNGLDRIDPKNTKRVACFDIHPEYLESTGQRYADLPGLELHCLDLAREAVTVPPVELVHAALIFEHAGLERCLENAAALSTRDLSVVLQLPSGTEEGVGASGFPSIETLRGHFTLVDPDRLRAALEERGFEQIHAERMPVASGKAFWMGLFTQGAESQRGSLRDRVG